MVDRQSIVARPRKIAVIAAILATVLAIAAIYAYYRSLPHGRNSLTPSFATGPRITLVSPPLEFSLQLEKTTYVSGENISVSISIRNTSNKTVAMNWSGYEAAGPRPDGYLISSIFPTDTPQRKVLDFVVSDENGTFVYGFIGRVETPIVSIFLATGETATQTFVWNPSADLIPSGTYFIKASTIPMRVEGWPFFEQPETPSITIHILEG